MKTRSISAALIGLCMAAASCSKKDAPVQQPVNVTGVQSEQVFAGKNRVKVCWTLPASQQISGCRIWWNKGSDSLTLQVSPGSEKDSVIISNLQEGSYSFSIALLDASGNISDKSSVSGKVYGDTYLASLKNISVQDMQYNGTEATDTIRWGNAPAGADGIQVKYTDSTGAVQNKTTPSSQNTLVLTRLHERSNTEVLYRTRFLPEPAAIDTFYTDWDTLKVMGAQVLWDGNASNGTGIWKAINLEEEGTVSVTNDPVYGNVWKFDKPAGSHRAEAHGVKGYQAEEGDDIYIGWVSKLIMPPALSTFAVFQWKSFPTDGSSQNHPLMLRTTDSELRFRDYLEGDIAHDDWSSPMDTGAWHSFVVRIRVSRDKNTGFIEFWYDGTRQTLDNGTTRQYCRTLDNDDCDPKWGVYGGDDSDAVNLVGRLKIATTYELAKPQ